MPRSKHLYLFNGSVTAEDQIMGDSDNQGSTIIISSNHYQVTKFKETRTVFLFSMAMPALCMYIIYLILWIHIISKEWSYPLLFPPVALLCNLAIS